MRKTIRGMHNNIRGSTRCINNTVALLVTSLIGEDVEGTRTLINSFYDVSAAAVLSMRQPSRPTYVIV